MSQFFNSVKDVSKNYSKYDKWEQEQADEKARKAWLAKNTEIPQDKLDLTKQRAETVIRATEIMDARSEDNCENVEQMVGILSSVPAMGIVFAQEPLTRYAEKTLTKKDESLLKNLEEELSTLLRNNSIDDAAIKSKESKILELTKKISKKKTSIRNYGMYGVLGATFLTTIGFILWGNKKQKEASRIGRYQAKQDELKGLENFTVYTPEQIAKAEEIASQIPDEKERKDFMKIIREMKEMNRAKSGYRAWNNKRDKQEIDKLKSRNINGPELEEAKEYQELITDTVKEINIKAEDYSENLENAFDTFGNLSFLLAAPIGFGLNKLLLATKASPKVRLLVSTMVPTLTALGISLKGTMEQKQASRVGRYAARKELLENPELLMHFSDEEMKQAQNVKAPTQKIGFFKKLGQNFKFLKTYFKDKKEYKEYKETVQKQNEKMQKAFAEIETTEAQKAEAKKLQKNVFRAFDEVDEMSQRYSEDVEAGTEIAKQVGSTVLSVGSVAGTAALIAGIVKGKISLAKPIKKLSGWVFDKNSSLKKGVDNLYEAFQKTGKKSSNEFQEALIKGKMKDFLVKSENVEIKKATDELVQEFVAITGKGMAKVGVSGKEVKIKDVLDTLLKDHFKQTRLAKWARNLTGQGGKLYIKKNMNKMLQAEIDGAYLNKKPLSEDVIKAKREELKKLQTEMGLNFNYENYKTLINTGIVASVPVLALMFSIPYAFNAWLTNIQKKAGKIGIMRAMEKIDDPRVFAEEKES